MARKRDAVKVGTIHVREHRAAIYAEGGRQIAVMLDARASAKLYRLQLKGETITGAVNRLLKQAKP
jgi:hypothetical protein